MSDKNTPPCRHLLLVLFLRNSWHRTTHHYLVQSDILSTSTAMAIQNFKIATKSLKGSVATNGINRGIRGIRLKWTLLGAAYYFIMMRFENYRDVCKVVGNKRKSNQRNFFRSVQRRKTLHYEWRLKILRWHDGMYTKARLCQKFDEQYGSRIERSGPMSTTNHRMIFHQQYCRN